MKTLKQVLYEQEYKHIVKALVKHKGYVRKAFDTLGLVPSQGYRLLKKHRISVSFTQPFGDASVKPEGQTIIWKEKK